VEIDVLPGVDLSSVDLDRIRKDLSEFRDRRRLSVGGDVHGREHDGEVDVPYQQIVIDRCNRQDLARLVIDDQECGILWRE
jgi:hypothetical protein